ncbi:MAG: molybdopterin converting factor subunit 1 [Thermomicrobiales bacterium]
MSQSTMSVNLLYFAIMRDLLGKSSEQVSVAAGTTVGDLFAIAITDHPDLARLENSVMIMVNESYANKSTLLQDGDEIAFIPPVSGGDHQLFTVTADVIDTREIESLVASPAAGAIVTFIGTVRDNARERDVIALDYEAYAPAAVRMLAQIGAEVAERWPGVEIAICHRTGYLVPGESSVVICSSSAHRDPAYEANAYAITRIKEIVPIWKKEHYTDGAIWVGSELDYQIETGRVVPPTK